MKQIGKAIAVYGAGGHTGRFVVDEALRRGLTVVAIGRDASRLPAGVQGRVAAVDDALEPDGDGRRVADVLVRGHRVADRSAHVDCGAQDERIAGSTVEAELAFKRRIADGEDLEPVDVRAPVAGVDAVAARVHQGQAEADLEG